MKKDFHKEEGPKKKKILQMKMYSDAIEDPDQLDDKLDIKDIEFRMRNDTGKVLENSKQISYKDLTLLKIILASGLYPSIAIGKDLWLQMDEIATKCYFANVLCRLPLAFQK